MARDSRRELGRPIQNSISGSLDLNHRTQAPGSLSPARRIRHAGLVTVLVALAAAPPVHGQFGGQAGGQYLAPGTPTLGRYSPNKEDFQKKIRLEAQDPTGPISS